MAESPQQTTEAPVQKTRSEPTFAFLTHLSDEVPQHDPDTPPEKQVSTDVVTDSIHLDLETRFVLAGIIMAAVIPLIIVGMAVWVAVINNWNFLSWME